MAKAALSSKPGPIARNEGWPLGSSARRLRVAIVDMLPAHAKVLVPGRSI